MLFQQRLHRTYVARHVMLVYHIRREPYPGIQFSRRLVDADCLLAAGAFAGIRVRGGLRDHMNDPPQIGRAHV